MANAVSSQTIFDGERLAAMKFINVSDGTAETGVLKVDCNALLPNAMGPCIGVTLETVVSSIWGMSVNMLWDATTDVTGTILSPGVYTFDFTKLQVTNNAGAGKTGNIRFTTIGAANPSTYSIVLTMVKSYGNLAPINVTLPAITGTTTVGQTLTCSTGSWAETPTSYTYQWTRDGVNIAAATASTYLLVVGDAATMTACVVTARNNTGATTATATAVGPIAP